MLNYADMGLEELRKLAMADDMMAQCRLAIAYDHGEFGLKKDGAKALYWARKSAEQGYSVGQVVLGSLYEDGHGVKSDREEAARWYKKAAAQGESLGQKRLDGLEAGPANNYPGFIVGKKDFEVNGNVTYRVNSNGLRVNLEKWTFDDKVGEWFRVKKKVDGQVIYDPMPYDERFTRHHHNKPRIRVIQGVNAVSFGALGLLLFAFGLPTAGVVLFGIGVAAILLPQRDMNKEKNIGPEPLKRKTEDFGPSAPTSPASHPAQDDLEYRPVD